MIRIHGPVIHSLPASVNLCTIIHHNNTEHIVLLALFHTSGCTFSLVSPIGKPSCVKGPVKGERLVFLIKTDFAGSVLTLSSFQMDPLFATTENV